jgi:hypothetical protein
MKHATGDLTADFLLGRIKLLRRVGDAPHRRDADRWEKIIRAHAAPEHQPGEVVNFATGRPEPAGATRE